MSTPPLLLGPKFKVLSLVGLSGSGIIGSFSAIHKSADRASETIDPAKAAIRQGLGYMFSGTSSLGSQADEWLSWLTAKRFIVLSFIGKNIQNIGSGQRSMVDQGQDWVKTARDAVRDYFDSWLSMLPYLFYFWNRTRNTLFGMGLSDAELKDELIQKIFEGDPDAIKGVADLLMKSPEFQKIVSKATELVKEFSSSFGELLSGENKDKALKAQSEIFADFGEKIGSIVGAITGSEGGDDNKLRKAIKDLSEVKKIVNEKFKSNDLTDEKAKKAEKSTENLLDWMVSSIFLPLFTDSCSEGDSDCTDVVIEDDDEEEQ